MLCQEDLPEYIEQEMPELKGIKGQQQNVYQLVRHMLKYTRSQMIRHNLNAAKKCMSLIEQLYHKGNNAVKNAIENVYIFSLSHSFFHDEDEKKQIMGIMPEFLFKLYKEQVVNSHL